MTKWHEQQRIYWGSEDRPPALEQMGLWAQLQPDGVLVRGYRPDGGDGELIIPYDTFSSLVNWGKDHGQRGYEIWSKLVHCPECKSANVELNRRNYPGNWEFEWKCSDCHITFTTNYRGYQQGEVEEGEEHQEESTASVSVSSEPADDGLGDLDDHPF